MPTYLHQCDNPDCSTEEWEDYYSISDDAKIECPQCHQNGHRIIAGGSGRGIVSLTGQDLVNSVKAGAADIEKHAANSENFASNFVGNAYQRKQKAIDQAKKDGLFRRSK